MEIPELSKEAKRPGLRSYSRLKKQELIEKIQRDWLLKSERLPIFLMKKFRWTSINQFSNQKKIRKGSGNPNNRYRKEKREKESREIEEMLGLRGGVREHSPAGGRLPKIKISNPEEAERERKIKEIKEINRNRPRWWKQPDSNGGNSQRIGRYEETIYNYKQRTRFWSQGFYAKSETVSLEADERKSPNNSQFDFKSLKWLGKT